MSGAPRGVGHHGGGSTGWGEIVDPGADLLAIKSAAGAPPVL
jgi:hypothetical protein